MTETLIRQTDAERPTALVVLYCDSPRCDVRDVQVGMGRAKKLEGVKLYCPLCTRQLRLGGYLDEQLVTVEDGVVVRDEEFEELVSAVLSTPTEGNLDG